MVDKDGYELPRRQVGEVLIRGDNVMKEYYKAPDITASTLVDGWFYTGDLGYQDEDGFFFITGRLKELIIKGGENIAPAEIDVALYKHPSLLEAAAVGVPDDVYGQEIKAFVVLKPGMQATEKEILDWCEKELGKFKTPKWVVFKESLPQGPSGKIQRLKLTEE
ncbi:putative sulfoacetate--CoA ligase [subsurface metagenome]